MQPPKIVSWNGRRGVADSDANLNPVQNAFLILAATVQFDLDLIVVKRNIGDGYDFARLNRLAVLPDIPVQFFFVDLPRIGDFNAISPKWQRQSR